MKLQLLGLWMKDTALFGDLDCWPALLVLFGYCGTAPLSVSFSPCLPACHPQLLAHFHLQSSTCPCSSPTHSPIAQLKLRVYIASDSRAGLVRACLGVSACHCSSLSKQGSSLRVCLGTSSTMVALCSFPSISKYCDHVLFHFRQCTIFAYYVDGSKKGPKAKEYILTTAGWMPWLLEAP